MREGTFSAPRNVAPAAASFGRRLFPAPRIAVYFLLLTAPAGLAASGCASKAGVTPVSAAEVDSLRRSSGARVVMLNVWATWCRPCMDEMPALVRLRREYSRDDLDLILLSADALSDLDSAVAPFLFKAGVDFQTFIIGGKDQDAFIRSLDPEWSGALPATLIARRGIENSRTLVGERSHAQFKEEIDALLAR